MRAIWRWRPRSGAADEPSQRAGRYDARSCCRDLFDAWYASLYCYDRRGNITSKTQVTAGKTLAVGYTYGKADRLMAMVYPSGATSTTRAMRSAASPARKYLYDRLYRPSRVDDGANVMQGDYAYNKTGDRTLKQFAGQAAQVYSCLAGTHRLGSVSGATRTYDGNGNTTDRGDGMPLVYDDRNRFTQVGLGVTNTYSHTGKGERVMNLRGSPTFGSSRQRYAYDEGGLLLAIPTYSNLDKPTGTTEYLYLDATPVAQVAGGALTYLETDLLGTPRIAADRTTNAQRFCEPGIARRASSTPVLDAA